MMNKQRGIYQIRNLVNGKVYIGSSVDIKMRWGKHKSQLKTGNHRNQHLLSAWKKYGKENFVFEKIEDVLEKRYLSLREQWFLDNIIKWDSDYNIAKKTDRPPSPKGRRHSQESKDKMSKLKKGKVWGSHSQETKDEMSKTRSGKNHPNWGKHRSKETKEKISKSQQGENHPNWGKHLSEKTRKKISKGIRSSNHSEKVPKGESCHLSKLKKEDVWKIRDLLSSTSDVNLSKIFNVSRMVIWQIRNKKTWRSV